MLRNALSFFTFLALLGAADLQAAWMRRYEGTQSVQRSLIAALPRGGYVVGVNGMPNAIMVIDASGDVKAARKLDPYELICLTTGPDGSIFAGMRHSDIRSSESPLLVKFRADLSVAWTRRLMTADGDRVGIARATGTRDGGVAVVAVRGGATIVTKLNRGGEVEWATGIDPSDLEAINTIRQTRDGSYVAAGASPRWAWLLKLGADGTLIWQRNYGPKGGLLHSVIENQDGALVAIGYFGNAAMIMKTTSRGDVVWSKVAALPGYGYSLAEAGGDAIATMSVGDTYNTLQIASIRPDGSLRWQRTFGPGEHGIMSYGFESAMLATTTGQVAYAAALGSELAIFAGSLTNGPGGCAWFSDGTVEFKETALRDEEVAVERFTARLVAQDADVNFAPLEVRATAERCLAPKPSWSSLHPDPERPTLAFRAQDTTAQRKAFAELLMARKFAVLEETAAKLRKNGPSADPLRPNLALRTFYQAFEDNEAAPVKTRLERLREWRAIHPQSVTARIALAGVLYHAAWDIRGSQGSDTVTASAAEATDKLLAEARQVLDGVGNDVDDPYYWYVRIPLTHILGLGDVREVGLKALALHPDPGIANRVAHFLYPQWGGSPTMYMQFADDATRVTKARYGEAMYLWLVYQIKNYESSEDYKQYATDWSRVLQGGEDLIQMNPDWPPSYHLFAALARKYEDKKTLRSLFQRPQLEWYEGADRLWLSRDSYEDSRRDALPPPPGPGSVSPNAMLSQVPMPPVIPRMLEAVALPRSVPPNIERAPKALLDTELKFGGNVQRDISGFLVTTPDGIVAVSAAPESFSSVARQFESWILWNPTRRKKEMHTGSLMTTEVSEGRRGVALRLEPNASAGVQPLIPAKEPPQFSDKVFVIACRRTHGGCEEKALAAKLAGKDTSTGGMRTYMLELADPPAENEAIGAAVVNERREVFAVVTLRIAGPKPEQLMLYAESLHNFVPGL